MQALVSVPLFTIKDLSLSCKASRRALLLRFLGTDVRMRLAALQFYELADSEFNRILTTDIFLSVQGGCDRLATNS